MAATPNPVRLAERYEVRQVLGQGGMGLVCRAYDSLIRREVAVKTLRDAPELAALQLLVQENGSWVLLDKWSEPGNNLASGKFGFYTPGGDEVGLANFNHLPDLKIK